MYTNPTTKLIIRSWYKCLLLTPAEDYAKHLNPKQKSSSLNSRFHTHAGTVHVEKVILYHINLHVCSVKFPLRACKAQSRSVIRSNLLKSSVRYCKFYLN